MRVRVDADLCSGQARCDATAPGLYELNDEGYNDMGEREVAESQLAEASRGALACPERAISLVDDAGEPVPDDELLRLAGVSR